MSKRIARRLWPIVVLVTMMAPIALSSPAHSQSTGTSTTVTSNQTGTDPEPTDPGTSESDVIMEAVLTALLIA
jgi:hypothetical protein